MLQVAAGKVRAKWGISIIKGAITNNPGARRLDFQEQSGLISRTVAKVRLLMFDA